ncbi:MAG TPA: MotA/TolQ/ExbB proton channel family protein [Lacipirellulaceae bacterium]|nr:MotA/TolQ/ExbB proton channel family protein [Lacipirellulaceae bacterium]
MLDVSFLLGAASTVGFYALMLSPGMKDSLLHRYTTEHLVDYVIVSLFFWGLMDVLAKLCSFPREVAALRRQWLPERVGREDAGAAPGLLAGIAPMPPWLQASRVGKRLTRALEYVAENGATTEYREYLQTLADRDADHSHANYTLIRFVVRVTPVLGFLGTVVHFGTALNGIDFEHMADKLSIVISEMGQAFNTTTVALAAAMVMMFAQFVCEWTERTILQAVDRTASRELFNRFEVRDANIPPFLSVVKDANDHALRLIAAQIERQTRVWADAFETIMNRFDDRQRSDSHAWADALRELTARHEGYDVIREERLRQLLDLVDSRQEKFMDHIQATLEKATALRDDFSHVVRTMDGIARGEGQLVQLQSVLTENLRVIHETQQIDDALHGLTAAIHLLTARHQGGQTKAA